MATKLKPRKNASRSNKPSRLSNRSLETDQRFFDRPVRDRHKNKETGTVFPKPRKQINLIPRNLAQEELIDLFEDNSKHIIFAVGSAGTGKSLLSTIHALQGLASGRYEKIIICRPAVGLDGTALGFLPGDLNAKMKPWTIPILDVIKEYFSVDQVERMIAEEVIEFASLEHMRGRTLKRCVFLFDEASNCSVDTMKAVLTRLGEGSRILVTGDLNQVDRKFQQNGLEFVLSKLKNSQTEMIGYVEFDIRHVERHPVVSEVLAMFGED